jgi:hypothetical protein
MDLDSRRVIADTWRRLGGAADAVDRCAVRGGAGALVSAFRVEQAAVAAVAVATLAAAELHAARTGTPPRPVTVDRRHVAAAFTSESWVRVDGEPPPDPWDPIAGDYLGADGWIRLHTNYRSHRAAARAVLGDLPDRRAIEAAVATWDCVDLESAVVAAGGCAAAMRDTATWRRHPQAAWLAEQPLVSSTSLPAGNDRPSPASFGDSPGEAVATGALDGLRVVDLTRVIAGPVCTRLLAAHGATVVRVDPPGFAEVPALVYDVTAGKRCVAADLDDAADRAALERLISDADVVVEGYRPGALDRFGFGPEQLVTRFPGLVVGQLTAWGDAGPWGRRRGFDSLVQMATGIADEGMRRASADRPRPMPAQALDHGSGYLLAAGLLRALSERTRGGRGAIVKVALARTAMWLDDLGRDPAWAERAAAPLTDDEVATLTQTVGGPLGNVRSVRCPGSIDGLAVAWSTPPSPIASEPIGDVSLSIRPAVE